MSGYVENNHSNVEEAVPRPTEAPGTGSRWSMATADSMEVDLLAYWLVIRKRLWLVILTTLLAGGTALFVSLQMTPEYQAVTTLFLNPAVPDSVLPFYVTRSVESLANTYAEFIKTRSFAQLVAQALDGALTPNDVQEALSAEYVRETQFFKIKAVHSDPAMAQKLANTAAEVFIAENISRQQKEQEQIRLQQDPVRMLERQRLQELQKSLQDELDYYAQRIASLQAEIAKLESEPRSEDIDERIQRLREELIRTQSLRVEVLSSLAKAQASLAEANGMLNVDTVVVVDKATLPEKPISPRIPLNTGLATAVGAMIGLGAVFLLEYLDYTVKTPEELDAIYGKPTLGVIGVIEDGNHDRDERAMVVALSDSRSPVAEAFRALRTHIQFANPGKRLRSLLITSAGPEEGKSVTAANLAVSLAQGGSRVILVDADLRRPALHRLFGVRRSPGLSNLIIDDAEDLSGYLQSTEVEGLWILSSGTVPPNPAELLGSPRAAEVMKRLEDYADVVIYDSPPAVTVTDALILATRVEGVLQVVLAGRTRRDLVRQGRVALERMGARVLGPVLNRVPKSNLGYYYYYYYGYYHRDGDESGEKPRRPVKR